LVGEGGIFLLGLLAGVELGEELEAFEVGVESARVYLAIEIDQM